MAGFLAELSKWMIATAILVSLIKMHSSVSEYWSLIKPMEYPYDQQSVIYENFTTPDFTLRIRYSWDSAEDVSKEKLKKDGKATSDDVSKASKLLKEKTANEPSSDVVVPEWYAVFASLLEASQDSMPKHVKVGGLLGKFDNGRLVVDVNETYAFWLNGQERLCTLLRNMTLTKKLGTTGEKAFDTPPLLNMTMDCKEMSQRQDFGQGNWITALYCVRIATALAKVDFQFQCSDGRDSKETLLLPWFDGYYPSPTSENPWPYNGRLPSEAEACTTKYPLIQVDKMADAIKDDVQRMAIELVGTGSFASPVLHDSNTTGVPIYSNVELDDVAIHFRCGDVFGGSSRSDFGIIKYNEYIKWIRNDTRTIGILTQPFDKDLNRKADSSKVDSCKQAVLLLVEYLESHFPSAEVRVHNGPNETLPLAYARLAHAKQGFTSLSSFGIFPIIGSFGDGYFQRGNRGVNPFATKIPSYFSNVHQMVAPVITTGQIRRVGVEETLSWLVSAGNSNFQEHTAINEKV